MFEKDCADYALKVSHMVSNLDLFFWNWKYCKMYEFIGEQLDSFYNNLIATNLKFLGIYEHFYCIDIH